MLSRELPALSGLRHDLADYVNPRALEVASGGQRFDANQTSFFLRDLTEVMGRTYDIKYPELKARQIFPVFTGVDPGAEGYVWRQFDRKGTAKIVHDYAADLDSVDVIGAEFQSRCLSLGVSYNYSIQDLRKARMAGIPLEARKALAARRAMENAFEQIAFFGVAQKTAGSGVAQDATQGLAFAPASPNTNDPMAMYGVTNFPGLAGDTTTNNWLNPATTVATIAADLNTYLLKITQNSYGVHIPNTIVFPLSVWSALNTMARSTTFTDDTVLQYLLKLHPEIKNVFWTPMLETAGLLQNGSTPGPRILLLERNEENIELVIPQEFEQLPPQMVNMTFKIPCHMRVGGIRVSYPKSIRFLDGTTG